VKIDVMTPAHRSTYDLPGASAFPVIKGLGIGDKTKDLIPEIA
jgi:hypothetical protein